MIHNIKFSNYKAFKEGNLKIKPLTILLGANSVGKSSLMQLFLLLQQTANADKNYKSALRLHGSYTNMGENLNLIKGKDKSKTLSLGFEFSDRRLVKILKEEISSRYLEEFVLFAGNITEFGKEKKVNKQQHELYYPSPSLFEHVISNNNNRFTSKEVKGINYINDQVYEKILQDINYLIQTNRHDPKSISWLYNNSFYNRYNFPIFYTEALNGEQNFLFLKKLLDVFSFFEYDGKFELKWELEIINKSLLIKSFSIFNNQVNLLTITFFNRSESIINYQFSSGLIDFEEYNLSNRHRNRRPIFFSDRSLFKFIDESALEEEFGNTSFSLVEFYIKKWMLPILKTASSNFEPNSINYVSPLRASPKRYYFLDKARVNSTLDTLDGDAIAEILKEDSYLLTNVNNWFKKFNLNIEINNLEDIIHKLTVNQHDLKLDITDVGFGISQVLPVIIQGFFSARNSITLIEQPEIHLHPKMQADIADLFIDIVHPKELTDFRKVILIETHSEYLLKRVRRRIAEGRISPENVAIYLIDPQSKEEGANIKELKIENKGAFDWPKDFYSDELLKDTIEFLKLQN